MLISNKQTKQNKQKPSYVNFSNYYVIIYFIY